MNIVTVDLRRIDKGGLIATVTLWFLELSLQVYECTWSQRGADGAEWMAFPVRRWADQSGDAHTARLITRGDDKLAADFRTAALEAIHRLAAQPTQAAGRG